MFETKSRRMQINAEGLIRRLREDADPASRDGMAGFGINTERVLGVRMPRIRALAREAGKDHETAKRLWQSGIAEARILAALMAEPAKVDDKLLEQWVADFDSWDVCDQCCMNLFRRTDGVRAKIEVWAAREEEFVRRAAFALIATLAVHEKKEPDARFSEFFPLIEAHSDDARNFVKKAVNWALRQIGKRNMKLNAAAIACAKRIARRGTPAARWIAADALRELRDPKILGRIKS